MAHQPAKRTGTFKQVRLTVSEAPNGAISVRVLAKPLQADWTYRHSVYHHVFKTTRKTDHWLDLLALAFYHVAGEALPEE